MEFPKCYKESIQLAMSRLGHENAVRLYTELVEAQEQGVIFLQKGNLQEARSLFEKSRAICHELSFPDHEPTGYLGDVYFHEGKYKEALEHFLQALSIAEKLPSNQGIINNLGRIGNVYVSEGKYKEALEYFQQALARAESLQQPQNILNNLGDIGEVYFREGKYKEALEYFQQALARAKSLPDPQGIINNLGRIGDVYFSEGNYKEALEYFQQALARAKILPYPQGIINHLGCIGDVYFREGDYKEALEYFLQALKLSQSLPYTQGIINNLGRIGDVYFMEGKNKEALEYFLQAFAQAESLKEPIGIINNLSCIGDVYFREGKYKEALEYFQKALKLSQSLQQSKGILNNLGHIGDVYFREGKSQEALKQFKQALKLSQSMVESQGIINNLGRIGDVYFMEGKYKKALKKFQKALAHAKSLPDPQGILNNLSNIGDVYFREGNYKEALEKFQQSLSIAQNLQEPMSILNNLVDIGNVYFSEGKYKEAFDSYNEALENVGRKAREQMTDWEGRVRFNEYVLRSYTGAIQSALAQAKLLESTDPVEALSWYLTAITFVEESRGVEVSHEVHSVSSHILPYEPNAWFTALQEFGCVDPFPPLPDFSEDENIGARRECINLPSLEVPQKKETVTLQEEEKNKTIIGLRQSLSSEELGRSLDKETVVLGYFIIEDAIYRYSLELKEGNLHLMHSPSALKVWLKDIEEELLQLKKSLDGYSKALSSVPQGDLNSPLYHQNECLAKLYQHLKIKEALIEISKAGRSLDQTSLLFSSEGILHSIPFVALSDEDDEKYLYEKVRDVHTTIGLRILGMQCLFSMPSELKCTFVGVPGEFQKDEKGNWTIKKEKKKSALPGVIQEYQGIVKILGKENVVCMGHGGEARHQALMETVRNWHNVGTLFYYSGHGLGIQEEKKHGLLLLDRPVTWLDLIENSQWNFRHQISVVLSSCLLGEQANLGKEMLGMIASLFSKGASSVISALWAVNDRATSILMPKLIENLKQNLEKGESHPRSLALKNAITYLRSLDNGKYDVPYFFAPFFVSGVA